MTVDYCKLNQVENLIAGAIPEVVSLLEEMNLPSGTWYAAIDLAVVFFFSSSSSVNKGQQKQVAFIWQGQQNTFMIPT